MLAVAHGQCYSIISCGFTCLCTCSALKFEQLYAATYCRACYLISTCVPACAALCHHRSIPMLLLDLAMQRVLHAMQCGCATDLAMQRVLHAMQCGCATDLAMQRVLLAMQCGCATDLAMQCGCATGLLLLSCACESGTTCLEPGNYVPACCMAMLYHAVMSTCQHNRCTAAQ
jgi:hypothetical protein